MTKQQEKVREGLLSKVKSIRNWHSRPDIDPLSAEDDTNDILAYLRSQGVVIRVERELPPLDYGDAALNLAARGMQLSMCKAGFEATMPLIEVNNGETE